MKRIESLDSLRGIAVALVLLWHYMLVFPSFAQGRAGIWEKILPLAWSGVDLFFVLSGFLIFTQLLRGQSFKVYAVRRTARILPLYLVVITLGFVLGTGRPSEWLFLQNFDYLHFTSSPFNVTWSLAIEVHFYVLAPFLVRKPEFPIYLLGGLLIVPALRTIYLLPEVEWDTLVYTHSFTHFDGLAVGGILAWLQQSRHAHFLQNPTLLSVSMFSLGVSFVLFSYAAPVFYSRWFAPWGYTWLALFYGVLLLVFLHWKLSWRPLSFLGRISYGVYLFHLAILKTVLYYFPHLQAQPLGPVSIIIIAFSGVILLAVLSWHGFESPLIQLSKRIEFRRTLVRV